MTKTTPPSKPARHANRCRAPRCGRLAPKGALYCKGCATNPLHAVYARAEAPKAQRPVAYAQGALASEVVGWRGQAAGAVLDPVGLAVVRRWGLVGAVLAVAVLLGCH